VQRFIKHTNPTFVLYLMYHVNHTVEPTHHTTDSKRYYLHLWSEIHARKASGLDLDTVIGVSGQLGKPRSNLISIHMRVMVSVYSC